MHIYFLTIWIVFLFFRLFTLYSRSGGTFDVLLPYCVSLRLLGGSASVFTTHKARAFVIFDKLPPPSSAHMLLLCWAKSWSGGGVGKPTTGVNSPTPRWTRRSLCYLQGRRRQEIMYTFRWQIAELHVCVSFATHAECCQCRSVEDMQGR